MDLKIRIHVNHAHLEGGRGNRPSTRGSYVMGKGFDPIHVGKS